ncbi:MULTISPECIES: metalloregulator ArsR/SmtB family transcription factor [Streptomyces]|uniref:Helix-turn-helix domain-containing protein n=1 Tax=Streptomyces mirabilis TaxID=68239 RepID=A0ABU3UAP7_9ACTN|nr:MULTISPECIES: helix-turn-helix domain-containing protein [Streptomyces]MCX4615654.1 helix-turn-helix domain-containing protein [Streptomyces mirabilis]MCX5355447.1 helix-turn-helix domain-containing protein [Streptomyces mirabilis]MDU8990988.1 helix-turn-helix domain-containing protein [Streptomyces mirabilis]NMI54581.1 helix-turn-helix domain-containing protein [Streptomyces sp. RLA2-12]QDN62862.1 helix-turn-helix domain-containing protein [Streptomyces sp. S1D4-20]
MEDIEAIAALQDPVRRRLYEYVAAQGREVGRNEAAEAAGVARTLAAHHLDRLAEAGLLESGSRRLTGRSGPGAGRPAKVYTRARAERSVSLPARDYRTAAELLAEAAEQAGLDAELCAAARRRGEALRGSAAPCGGLEQAVEMLAARGYEPHLEGVEGATGAAARVVRMRNCPFHAVAERFPPLVCGMNLALLEGLLGTDGPVHARMDARPGDCCVVVETSKNNGD